MKKIALTTWLLLCFITARASNRYEKYEVFVSPTGGEWKLKTGDKASFEVRVFQYDAPPRWHRKYVDERRI